jgi:hypothetical protein
MITHVELAALSPALQKAVLAEYRAALIDPDRKLNYREAAWLYGYTYATIRWLVHHKRVRATGRQSNRRISHQAMLKYARSKQKDGSPRKALKNAQITIN